MAQGHVADLVGEHAGNLAFVLRRLQHPAIDVHRPARQGERVQVADVDDIERVTELAMLELGGDALRELLTHALHIIVNAVVAKHGKLLRNFLRCLPAGFDVLLNAVFVFGRDDLRLAENERNGCEQRNDRGGRVRGWMAVKSLKHNHSLKQGTCQFRS